MSIRKNFYLKNGRVIDAVTTKPEGERSEFIETCVLFYLDRDKTNYAKREDLTTLNDKYDNLNNRYLQIKQILEELAADIYSS